MVQRIQREVALRELSLPKPSTEGIDRVVSAGDVFREVEMGQQLGARNCSRRLRFLVAGASDGSLGTLTQGLIYGLTESQRILGSGGQ
jgi:hypothetical protein